MSKNAVEVPYFINETLPDDFTNVLGALLLAGWSYSIENTRDEHGTNRVKVTGFRPKMDGTQASTARPIQIVWEWSESNGWSVAADETGHPLKRPGSGGRMFQFVSPDQLVDTIGRNTSSWNLLPSFTQNEEEMRKAWDEQKKADRAERAKARKEERAAKRAAKGETKAIEAGTKPAKEAPAEPKVESGIVSEEVIEG